MNSCVKCRRPLAVDRIGITVLELAKIGPYRIYQADILSCSECGLAIITKSHIGVATKRHEAGFQERVSRFDKHKKTMPEMTLEINLEKWRE